MEKLYKNSLISSSRTQKRCLLNFAFNLPSIVVRQLGQGSLLWVQLSVMGTVGCSLRAVMLWVQSAVLQRAVKDTMLNHTHHKAVFVICGNKILRQYGMFGAFSLDNSLAEGAGETDFYQGQHFCKYDDYVNVKKKKLFSQCFYFLM